MCFRSILYLRVLQPPFASGAPGRFGVRSRAVLGGRAVITPSLRHLGLPLKHLSSYYHHGFNFLNFTSVAKLVVSAMKFSWADAQGVLPSLPPGHPGCHLPGRLDSPWGTEGTLFGNSGENSAISPSSLRASECSSSPLGTGRPCSGHSSPI